MFDVDPVETHVDALWRRAFILDHMSAHGLAIHHDAVREVIREASETMVARLKIAVGALTGKYYGHSKGSRHGHAENGQGQVESMNQLDAMAANILTHPPRAPERVEGHEGAHWKDQNRNAGLAQFLGTEAIVVKASDVRSKLRFVEGLGQLGHLALAAAQF